MYIYVSIDIYVYIGNEIMTGSWRPDNQLEI
jgi:fucose permease